MVEILKLMLNQDSQIVICARFVNCDLVICTQPSGPLCLWQCLELRVKLFMLRLGAGVIDMPSQQPQQHV